MDGLQMFHYELVDKRTGRVIKACDDFAQLCEEACSHLATYPEDRNYVNLVIRETNDTYNIDETLFTLDAGLLYDACTQSDKKDKE